MQLKEPFHIIIVYGGKEYKLIVKQTYWFIHGQEGYCITAGNVVFHVALRFSGKEWLWSTLNEVKHWHLWNAIVVQLEAVLKEMRGREK